MIVLQAQHKEKDKRQRGVILTLQGLEKLEAAKTKAEFEQNSGNRYTLEQISDRTRLAVNTVMKIYTREAGVDRNTLKRCFSAFSLILEPSDYARVFPQSDGVKASHTPPKPEKDIELELPLGQVPLDSSFYVERQPIESQCYKTILQPGALIRIQAPRRMGKTSLMARILEKAAEQGYQTIAINFQLADREIVLDLDKFLRWFCANVGLGLQLENQMAEYWDELFGSQLSCKMYFEEYLLAATDKPIVLALDDIDRLFPYSNLASDFFGLLRSWHEEAKNREIWRKLRLVVVHSAEIYIPLSANRSPFNVGLPIGLPPFNSEQVQNLAKRQGLDLSAENAKQLVALVNGNPYLIRLALYHIGLGDVTPEQVLQTSGIAAGIYSDRLQRELWNLQQEPELLAAFVRVVKSSIPVELGLVEASKLEGMGLVNLQGNLAAVSCQLYWEYFGDRFSSIGGGCV
ncbi:MAG: AAA-like domain-containing protein [Microcoleus sp. PH2017_29_MFU_D_A]|uniref:AAA-like domain-containing protein n=1 Tax=unclassified Microcoleus TaxID=2642155 RepID=UPI001D2344DB|nr:MULTISPECIES: AAA-like domain-containing protein [unclassified Microcoleus]MCC3503546.1 AAA-like domain-containing protein [Microcoleus sp. PH2017_19_SFW_U_A]MCC3511524.1 AAA-like domain-containing protein [Microcoleus sp. PH2017_17_BER_D_A]TAG98516.1 MAG: serine/threonine protein kinase [Oscillatoriales cyanobacterium]MCC3521620.1 AAA-like domain-containing protein [Microcoleus sp. PH2017_20_SFW_D_A]MCC3553131.1 AAA-like domain-containing protein [Microcoleus sp. PH2017_35_SFW_U_B]